MDFINSLINNLDDELVEETSILNQLDAENADLIEDALRNFNDFEDFKNEFRNHVEINVNKIEEALKYTFWTAKQ